MYKSSLLNKNGSKTYERKARNPTTALTNKEPRKKIFNKANLGGKEGPYLPSRAPETYY